MTVHIKDSKIWVIFDHRFWYHNWALLFANPKEGTYWYFLFIINYLDLNSIKMQLILSVPNPVKTSLAIKMSNKFSNIRCNSYGDSNCFCIN